MKLCIKNIVIYLTGYTSLYMNNKTLVWLLVAVIVLAGAWYYFSNSSGGTVTETPVATTTPTTATTAKPAAPKVTAPAVKKPTVTTAKIVGVGTIPYLIGLKQSLLCSVKTTSGSSRSGTMYVAGGKVRGNFLTSSMIDDGTYLYAWFIGATKGLQLLAASSVSGSAIATNGGVDLATDLSFACNPWTEDASVFTPPSSVAFSSSY